MSKPLHVGRLWLLWCALRHPNRWMIVWQRGLPEWDSRTKWKGSDKPGPYWKGCTARLERKRGVAPEDARCRFPNCDCMKLSEDEKKEWERLRAERVAYREGWVRRLAKRESAAADDAKGALDD
jgi:hypothetical protein